jgi:phytanoyl-CoA hydroxylase
VTIEYAKLAYDVRRHGYATAPGVLDAATRTQLDDATDGLIAMWTTGARSHPDYWSCMIADCPTPVLYRIHNFDQHLPELVRNALSRPALTMALAAIMMRPVVPAASALIIKMPFQGASVPWHRDPIAVPPCSVYNVSVFLDDATVENGCLEFVPGSHLWPDDYPVDANVRPTGAVPSTASAGDILIHDVRVLHGSGSNSGPTRRRSLVAEYQPDWVRDLAAAGHITLHGPA